jgi:hypothetical protein
MDESRNDLQQPPTNATSVTSGGTVHANGDWHGAKKALNGGSSGIGNEGTNGSTQEHTSMTTHPTTHPTQPKAVVASNDVAMVNGCNFNDNGKSQNHPHCNDNDNHYHDGNPQPQLQLQLKQQQQHHQTPTPPQVTTGTKAKPNCDTIVESPSLTTLEAAAATMTMEDSSQPSQQQCHHHHHQCTPITVASDRVHYTDNVIRSNYTYVRSLYCSKTSNIDDDDDRPTDESSEVSYI